MQTGYVSEVKPLLESLSEERLAYYVRGAQVNERRFAAANSELKCLIISTRAVRWLYTSDKPA